MIKLTEKLLARNNETLNNELESSTHKTYFLCHRILVKNILYRMCTQPTPRKENACLCTKNNNNKQQQINKYIKRTESKHIKTLFGVGTYPTSRQEYTCLCVQREQIHIGYILVNFSIYLFSITVTCKVSTFYLFIYFMDFFGSF